MRKHFQHLTNWEIIPVRTLYITPLSLIVPVKMYMPAVRGTCQYNVVVLTGQFLLFYCHLRRETSTICKEKPKAKKPDSQLNLNPEG